MSTMGRRRRLSTESTGNQYGIEQSSASTESVSCPTLSVSADSGGGGGDDGGTGGGGGDDGGTGGGGGDDGGDGGNGGGGGDGGTDIGSGTVPSSIPFLGGRGYTDPVVLGTAALLLGGTYVATRGGGARRLRPIVPGRSR
jgi:hypothetical protein